MVGRGAQAKSSVRKAQGCLFPLERRKVEPCKVALASADHAVKHVQSHSLRGGRVAPHAMQQASESSRATQKPQCHLGILQLSQSIE